MLTAPQDVEQDKLEFKKTQEADRVKVAKNKKVQENVDRAREQNARRKLDKVSKHAAPPYRRLTLYYNLDPESRMGLG